MLRTEHLGKLIKGNTHSSSYPARRHIFKSDRKLFIQKTRMNIQINRPRKKTIYIKQKWITKKYTFTTKILIATSFFICIFFRYYLFVMKNGKKVTATIFVKKFVFFIHQNVHVKIFSYHFALFVSTSSLCPWNQIANWQKLEENNPANIWTPLK